MSAVLPFYSVAFSRSGVEISDPLFRPEPLLPLLRSLGKQPVPAMAGFLCALFERVILLT